MTNIYKLLIHNSLKKTLFSLCILVRSDRFKLFKNKMHYVNMTAIPRRIEEQVTAATEIVTRIENDSGFEKM